MKAELPQVPVPPDQQQQLGQAPKNVEIADQSSPPSNPTGNPDEKKKKFKVRFDEAYQKSHEEKS